MPTEKTYYQILGVTPDAENIVIRAAYKALSHRYHPDKFKGSAEEAEAKMKVINFAYSILSDKDKRKAYDEELKASGRDKEFGEEQSEADLLILLCLRTELMRNSFYLSHTGKL